MQSLIAVQVTYDNRMHVHIITTATVILIRIYDKFFNTEQDNEEVGFLFTRGNHVNHHQITIRLQTCI